MTKRCGKCEHYTPDEYKVGFGDCALTGYVNDGMTDSTRAYAWDYEGYSAGVYVGVNFGCIHWMKKEQHTGESK
jgi:hypothetical protein